MPAKKKGKKGKKDEAPPPEPSEFDDMTIDALRQQIAELRPRLDRAQMDRNQVQLDRDTLQTFYDITRREVSDLDLKVMSKDREMEVAEDNHRVEVRVYSQKVKHLEYEHTITLKAIEGETEGMLKEEGSEHAGREAAMRAAKDALKMEKREKEFEHATEITETKLQHEKNLSKLSAEFAANLELLRDRYEKRLERLRASLELRRKVEIHELEERKNLHVNDLIRSHEASFAEIKKYYNEITKDNLKSIKKFKAQIAELHRSQAANQKLTMDIAQENKKLTEPLAIATAEVAALRADLRDAEKDRMSLANAKARLQTLEKDIRLLAEEHERLSGMYSDMERERAALYERFEETIEAVKKRSEFRNLLLEKRLADLQADYEARQTTLSEVLVAANLDPGALAMVGERLDRMLDDRNRMIRDLQYSVARVTKAHNDALRVYESKLHELGVAAEETGFAPLMTATSVGPAGLVAAPTFPRAA